MGALAIAIVHFVSSFLLAFVAGTTGGWPMQLAANILVFPLSIIPEQFDLLPPLANWLLWVAVSLCWGVAIAALIRRFVGGARPGRRQ